MLVLLGALQLAACFGLLMQELKRRSVAVFFWGMVTIVFAVPHFIVSLTGNYTCRASSIAIASCFVCLFCMVYWVFRMLSIKPKNVASCDSLSLSMSRMARVMPFDICVAVVVFTFVVWLLAFSRLSLGGLGNTSWGEFYSATSSLKFSPLYFAPYIFACCGGAIINTSKAKRWGFCIAIVICCLAYMLITKNRVVMLAFACPFILLLVNRYERISGAQIATAVFAVALVIYLVYAVLVFRHAGTIDTFLSSFSFSSFNSDVLNSIFSGEGELGLRNIFYFFVDGGNNFYGFGSGATYIRILLFWLPGGLSAGLKPDDFAITMASAYMGAPLNTIYSVHPTFFGDAYANFGFMGFLLGIVWAVIFNVIDRFIGKRKDYMRPYLISAIAFSLIVIGRGSVYNGVVIAIVTLCILMISKTVLNVMDVGSSEKSNSSRFK